MSAGGRRHLATDARVPRCLTPCWFVGEREPFSVSLAHVGGSRGGSWMSCRRGGMASPRAARLQRVGLLTTTPLPAGSLETRQQSQGRPQRNLSITTMYPSPDHRIYCVMQEWNAVSVCVLAACHGSRHLLHRNPPVVLIPALPSPSWDGCRTPLS